MAHRMHRPLLLLPVALAVALSTTGCGQIANTLERTHEESFTDRAAAAEGWEGVTVPAWLPDDATGIRTLATTDESNAVVLALSGSPLPDGCVDAEREGVPFDSPDWAPTPESFPDRVQRCGDYEVMPVDGGWLGWFSANETGQTPRPAVD